MKNDMKNYHKFLHVTMGCYTLYWSYLDKSSIKIQLLICFSQMVFIWSRYVLWQNKSMIVYKLSNFQLNICIKSTCIKDLHIQKSYSGNIYIHYIEISIGIGVGRHSRMKCLPDNKSSVKWLTLAYIEWLNLIEDTYILG